MSWILAFILVVLQIIGTNGTVNYCGAKMCGHSNAHTYCKYRPGPSPSCTGYMEAPLSAEEKTRILARLNQRRSEVACGWRLWSPAGDMLKLRWIEELSREAQRWADQCRPPRIPEEHDTCRDLYSISVGQCVASIVGEAPGLRPESMVDMWFMQRMLYEGNITSYVPARIKNYYGDFAQMMWSRTYMVGCGRSRFMADWRGRLRSVERLVCNFAPRGPLAMRPLWIPAEAASICPPRSYPDLLPGLCTYQNNIKESRNFNDSLSIQDNYLLETVFEIEKNESLDYLGSLDELYLTKIAIATIGTSMPVIPLYYSVQNTVVFGFNVDKRSEGAHNSISTHESTEKSLLQTKVYVKTHTIGRPKPYDINELNDDIWEQKLYNLNDIQDSTRTKDKDFYTEYGLVENEEGDIVNISTTMEVLVPIIHTDTTTLTVVKLEENQFNKIINTTYGMVGSEKNFINITEEMNELLISNKTVDDYLSDPETVRALQDALDQMERTLASPSPVSTSGKVRRELRNLEADLQKVASTQVPEVTPVATEVKKYEGIKMEERNKAKDRGPMLSMVLKYMPYLKPYEQSIVGDAHSYGNAACYDLSVLICSFLINVFVL